MTIELVEVKHCLPIVKSLFSEDAELLDKYHIASGLGLDTCAQRTVNDMLQFAEKDYTLYVIKDDGDVVAFFGKESFGRHVFMTGFYVKIKYRTKEFISYFWETVGDIIKARPLYSCVFAKNTRAADFLTKKGELIFEKDNILTFKIF